ncbi:ATP-binding protein [Nocardia sp. CDC160]|uniref:ATP-binding protein n=1 Tax=Nocardia sp. CDC160 TaxID=3112166 RepID=UPI002DBE5A75|nr:ATP-binding protein [Nocardia sp. CDC160]MEC3915344.1 ATP-binding protein [Nocardia sp. CDC160]
MNLDAEIRWYVTTSDDAVVAWPQGTVDLDSCGRFADSVVKLAAELPRAVIVMTDRLDGSPELIMSAILNAAIRLSEDSGVPVVMVHRSALQPRILGQFVPVFTSLAAARRAIPTLPRRQRATTTLPMSAECSQRARRFIAQICADWNLPQLRAPAQLVATELVHNVFLYAPASPDIGLRLELRDPYLLISVADADPHPPIMQEPRAGEHRYYGLHLVDRLSTSWGYFPRKGGGKVVWASLLLAGTPASEL